MLNLENKELREGTRVDRLIWTLKDSGLVFRMHPDDYARYTLSRKLLRSEKQTEQLRLQLSPDNIMKRSQHEADRAHRGMSPPCCLYVYMATGFDERARVFLLQQLDARAEHGAKYAKVHVPGILAMITEGIQFVLEGKTNVLS